MQSKKRKIASAVGAGVLVIAIALTGTYAWQSISQKALNERTGDINPGGRLHDDFNGTNKDIYVENFTDPQKNGVPIYVRVRLDEYMEIGPDAGKKSLPDGETKQATPLVAGTKIDDVTTWTTHKPPEGGTVDKCENGAPETFHNYWGWDLGGETVFMPTFNKNKDSLKSDLNGTIAGLDGDPEQGEPYDDYKEYTAGQKETGNAVYDADDNDDDEGEAAVDGVNITTVEEEHTAKATQNAEVMTMAEWKAKGSPIGRFWVYDADGWAYWAEGLMPGESTGLLLDGINLNKPPNKKWYYGIHVVAQFATRGDWGDPDKGTGFYDTTQGTAPTDDALFLLKQAADLLPAVTGISMREGQQVYVKAGESLILHPVVKFKNATGDAAETAVEWKIDPLADSAFENGTLKTTADMLGNFYRITATSTYDKTFSTYTDVYIYPADAESVVTGEDNALYVKYADNTFRAIQANGSLSNFISAGIDRLIGNTDDNANVTVLETPDPTYGSKFIGPDADKGFYIAAGTDGLLGTEDDVKVWGDPWPSHIIPSFPWMQEINNIAAGSTSTVKIDNIDWYVLAKDGNKALIWSKDPVQSWGEKGIGAFGSTNSWKESDVRHWLNNNFLQDNLTVLKKYANKTAIKTRAQVGQNGFTETEDTVFLLSEADLFGTFNNEIALPGDYTFNGKKLEIDDVLKSSSESLAKWIWLRSPRISNTVVAEMSNKGVLNYLNNTDGGVRPALWVDIS